MALVNLNDVLTKARVEKYAVGAFDVSTLDMAIKVVEAAEELNSPVILMVLKHDVYGIRFDAFISGLKIIAINSAVPVVLHLDHATDFDLIQDCIDAGITSVMFDGSMLPLEENIAKTRQVVELAHAKNVTVEAELGHVGDGIVGCSETDTPEGVDGAVDVLTNPQEMSCFIEQTGVDCLAVSFGTSHGVYVAKPVLDLIRLSELNEKSSVPLVMHGGSGTPDQGMLDSIERGVCKINIYSEMLHAFNSEMKDILNNSEHLSLWPSSSNKKPLLALKNVVKNKIKLFKSENKA